MQISSDEGFWSEPQSITPTFDQQEPDGYTNNQQEPDGYTTYYETPSIVLTIVRTDLQDFVIEYLIDDELSEELQGSTITKSDGRPFSISFYVTNTQ